MTGQNADTPWPRPAIGWYAVAVLLLAFLVSFVDRAILGLLVVPIKRDLGLSDTAAGLLLGVGFAVPFSAAGFMFAWLSDRHSRIRIIGFAVAFWSLATTACGFVQSFTHLLLARAGVAVGESALSPGAFSLISDYFPRERLGRAMGVYMTGAFCGAGVAFLAGGAILSALSGLSTVHLPLMGDIKPWQFVFVLVGLPGLLVAALTLTVKEPVRRGRSAARTSTSAVLHFVSVRRKVLFVHYAGFGLLAVNLIVVLTWAPTMFVRAHGMAGSDIAQKLGLILLILSTSGVFFGGWLADALRASGKTDAPLIVGVVAATLAVPFVVYANLTVDSQLAIVLYCPLVFVSSLSVACAPTAIQLVTPNQFRAQVSAGYMIAMNIIGSTFGPTGVGLVTDFVFHDESRVGSAMALVSGVCSALAALALGLGRRAYREAVTLDGH